MPEQNRQIGLEIGAEVEICLEIGQIRSEICLEIGIAAYATSRLPTGPPPPATPLATPPATPMQPELSGEGRAWLKVGW